MKPPGLVLIGQREAEIGKSNKNKRKKKRKFGVAEKAAEKEKKRILYRRQTYQMQVFFSGAKQPGRMKSDLLGGGFPESGGG